MTSNTTPTTAATRAAERNLATIARAEAMGLTLYGTLPESAEYWAESGVHTGAELDSYLAYCDWAETHKEVRNFRARGYDWRERTAEEWEEMTRELLALAREADSCRDWEDDQVIGTVAW